MALYELWLADQFGARIKLQCNWESLVWQRITNGTGYFELAMARQHFDPHLWFGKDRRLEIWRKATGAPNRLIQVYFLRSLDQLTRQDRQYVIIGGPDPNYLISGRNVMYAAESTQSLKSDYADDMMKAIVDENLGDSATDSDRDIETAGYLTIQPDLGAGASIERAFAYEPMLVVLQDIAEASQEAGTRCYFDVVPLYDSSQRSYYEFRTYTGQRGMNRTWSSDNNAIILSEQMGNLVDARLLQDWIDEVTVVYGGGQGELDAREVVEVEDATRAGESVFSRRESFYDYPNAESTTALTNGARAQLREGRPRRIFTATLTDSPQFRFQRDWDFGDLLTAEYDTEQYDVEVRGVEGRVAGTGFEIITAQLEYIEQVYTP